MTELDTATALRHALAATPRLRPLAQARLVALPGRGIAHEHYAAEGVKLARARIVLRVPRVSQWGLPPEQQLAYEAVAFARAEASRATPRFLGVVAPAPGLPMGALAVERIDGPKPVLPRDLPAIAKSLARIHALPVPAPQARAPLLVNADPIGETLKAVREQAAFLREAGLRPMAAAAVSAELARAEGLSMTARPPALLTLIGSDTHPGNFLMPRRRRAIFVDLEKAQYGNPAIDLAHATLYTSTMWDPDCAARLTAGDVADFHKAYFAAMPRAFGERLRPWLAPMRRLIWLRTLTWCIRWRVLSRREGAWSRARLAPEHAIHIERTVEDYVDPERIGFIRETLDADEERFSA